MELINVPRELFDAILDLFHAQMGLQRGECSEKCPIAAKCKDKAFSITLDGEHDAFQDFRTLRDLAQKFCRARACWECEFKAILPCPLQQITALKVG